MFGLRVLIFLVACLSWSHCTVDKYCSICPDHTMCIYKGLGKQCTEEGESGVSESEKEQIVELHNWLRKVVASGGEHKGLNGSQPKAANMKKMEWDDDLAKVAQKWADQCRFEHDTCRNDPRWKVGQNIYWKFRYPHHVVNWTEAVLSWYSEVSQYDPREVVSYQFSPAVGHYTQMLWHDTYAIGCGRRDYGPNKIYVCNYGPTGNWLDEPMYTIGEPCSECPTNWLCDEYLCARPSSEKPVDKKVANENEEETINHIPNISTRTNEESFAEANITNRHATNVKLPLEEEIGEPSSERGSTTKTCKKQRQEEEDGEKLTGNNELNNASDRRGHHLDDETMEDIRQLKMQAEEVILKALKRYNVFATPPN